MAEQFRGDQVAWDGCAIHTHNGYGERREDMSAREHGSPQTTSTAISYKLIYIKV
jgi:hypothetical protein